MREVKKSFYNVSAPSFGEIKKAPFDVGEAQQGASDNINNELEAWAKEHIDPSLDKQIKENPSASQYKIPIQRDSGYGDQFNQKLDARYTKFRSFLSTIGHERITQLLAESYNYRVQLYPRPENPKVILFIR